nr:MAG TPA: hypothetical protein [Bacteriophage sp.]
MFKVKNNNITITRGDTGVFRVAVTDEAGAPYKLQDGDKIVMTVKTSTTDKAALISVDVVDGVAKITPAMTSDLEYGTYYYDCQLTTAAGDVVTFITPHLFTVAEEVTF